MGAEMMIKEYCSKESMEQLLLYLFVLLELCLLLFCHPLSCGNNFSNTAWNLN
ncbi:hypothetical protein KFK09_003393 [Dendrobium nobile]|uniref:Uncharacterized protein n=1 Tax=Dendrobium nobile TaxID=94219 RepID=A0A8T3BXP8_DENNO|nr:hypothetical protein KFK09_003393 [Dendrobium nobile]